ncbi:hypothetical protein VOLCADRAFT_120406 [Volvox carteri f. nagariensis]|uniref:2Fe-2S ferredoxin-type domain-containing protein n=1 Tax=Volvox carteri f. nagariensis TaxID=3068 RepID=D8TKE9_VOLCA|nr:uncharacterized protein VOLCADRAFT_120406 [Volvox carteri f. nagariensis]EFJ52049.1 hypothetical protein VOLCADRAFT_120406 [Volvox carteri f. nagariensis]|eukprot:XP_002946823.1 hypothetical protein VOLCADRAFT_120406 [Volvox carteri f. nagariensis]
MAPSAVLRSCNTASTSASSPAFRPATRSRVHCVRVQANEAFCRDKVSSVRQDVSSKGISYKVAFVGAGGETREVSCPDNQYILDAAEAAGLDLPATCRGGICGACVARVAKGTIDPSDIADLSFTLSEEEQEKGMALLCMTRATSDLTIETQSDWGYSLGVGEWKGATGKFSAKPDPLVGVSWSELKKHARAARAIRPALSYFKAFIEAQARIWSPEDPDGNIILSVAENRLTSDMVKERLHLSAADFPEDALCYADMRGLPRLRAALSNLLESTFMKGISVDKDDLTVSAGAGAILENLFHCIAGAGDAVLIPAPYYPAFDNDLQVKCGLDAAAEAAAADCAASAVAAAAAADGLVSCGDGHHGHRRRVAALLYTSPNNPLGIMYRRETVVEMLRWCLSRRVHLVSDEIYGNSVFAEGQSFTSAEVVARQEVPALPHSERLPELHHVVWGLSKDLCASGLRCGCLHTRNKLLHQALDNLGYFCAVPNPLQWALTHLLEDREWVNNFLATNRARLKASYDKLEAALKEADIPHLRADSAMFCWVDLRRWLPPQHPGWSGEQELWSAMCRECRVLLTPGEQCHASEPGFFRICWAWMPGDALPEAVRRLVKHFGGRGATTRRSDAEGRDGPAAGEASAKMDDVADEI